MAREGAKHLYLLDFSDQVVAFSKALQTDFPDTKASPTSIRAVFEPEC
jgi:hypothetical protein